MGHRGLPRKLALNRTGARGHAVREPAGAEGQHHRRGHAAQLPPLHPPVQALFDAQRRNHLLTGNRLLQQLPMQLAQFLALHTPRMKRGLRLRVGCDTHFELGRHGGRQSPVDKRVQALRR